MILIPSVDILDGKTVRLYKGQFDKVTFYETNPLDLVKSYADMGYSMVHIVNLDRANSKVSTATERMIEDICRHSQTKIQMGGGLRNEEAFKQANDLGISRFVIGTLAVLDPQMTRFIIHKLGKERFTFAFDVQQKDKKFIVKTHGWTKSSSYTLHEILEEYQDEATNILCTDIEKDGSLSSPNFQLYGELKSQYPQLFIQASGGIHSEEDLFTLANNAIDAVVVGKAIHEKKIDLKQLSQYFTK